MGLSDRTSLLTSGLLTKHFRHASRILDIVLHAFPVISLIYFKEGFISAKVPSFSWIIVTGLQNAGHTGFDKNLDESSTVITKWLCCLM